MTITSRKTEALGDAIGTSAEAATRRQNPSNSGEPVRRRRELETAAA